MKTRTEHIEQQVAELQHMLCGTIDECLANYEPLCRAADNTDELRESARCFRKVSVRRKGQRWARFKKRLFVRTSGCTVFLLLALCDLKRARRC